MRPEDCVGRIYEWLAEDPLNTDSLEIQKGERFQVLSCDANKRSFDCLQLKDTQRFTYSHLSFSSHKHNNWFLPYSWAVEQEIKQEMKQQQDNHQGMIQNPITGEWRWL